MLRVGDHLAPGHKTYQALPTLGHGHHGGSRAVALCARYHHRLAALDDGNARVGGTEINTDYPRHSRLVRSGGRLAGVPGGVGFWGAGRGGGGVLVRCRLLLLLGRRSNLD